MNMRLNRSKSRILYIKDTEGDKTLKFRLMV